MLLCIPRDWVVRLVRCPFLCTLRGVPYDLPVFFVDPPSRCRSGDSPLPTFEGLRSYLTRFSAVPLVFWAVCSPRLTIPGDTFLIQFRAAIVKICLCLYSEGGEATLGIALDWVVEMAWFLFLVYVCVFPTIYHNLVLIP
ncbi:hypothetical protein M404DRAFT_1007313, partial [Pisolithus tinctorius Marx 270]